MKGALLALAALLASGCYGWPAADTAVVAWNKTDAPVDLEVTITDSEGGTVFQQSARVEAQGRAELGRVREPAGDYTVSARAAGLEGRREVSLGRAVPQVVLNVMADRIEVDVAQA